jgi:predicted DNA-binding ribbon-helix-helix protein
LRKNNDGSAAEPKRCEIGLLLQDVDEYRTRLSDISWMMRLACQPIARRANQEDEVDGRFFAKRFDCARLETCADILSCSIYVDLNLIHAGMATTPEESEFTSAYDRIRARWQST